jgi:ABC-type transport system substrate-binding protein
VARTYRYDPARAKQLLAEAGYPNGITTEILIRGTSGPHVSIPQVYQQDLAKAGIQARLVPTELPQYWPKLFASNFWVVSHATGETDLDPNGLFIGAACCRPFRNFFKITENKEWFPAYRDMIYKARDASDQATRKKLYRDLLVTMQQQAWLIPVAWRQEWFAHRDTLKGFRMDSHAHIWLDEAWLAR